VTLSTPIREREVDDTPRGVVPHGADLVNPDGTPTPAGWRKIGDQFRKEMPVKQRKGRGNQQFDYVTARQVADRLDTVIGPGNWETHFLVIDSEKQVVQCTLVIFGQRKADVGYPNNPGRPELEDEPYKAAYSDAFKRAAVAWGIGRFLYDDL
jgi:hypothetical protein